jgi:hypothetical protein
MDRPPSAHLHREIRVAGADSLTPTSDGVHLVRAIQEVDRRPQQESADEWDA